MTRATPTIRQLLNRLALATLLPAVLTMVGLLAGEYRQERLAVEAQTQVTAREMAEALNARLDEVQGHLDALAVQLAASRGDLTAFQADVARARALDQLDTLVVLDATGRQVFSAGQVAGVLPNEGSLRAWLAPLERGRPVVSELGWSAVTQGPIVGVGLPVLGADGQRFSLNAGLDAHRFGELLRRRSLPPEWIATIADATGTIVARTHDPQRFVGQKLQPEVLARLRSTGEDVLNTETVDGVPAVTAFRQLPNVGWTLVVNVPRRVLTGPLYTWMAYLAAAIAAMVSLSFWVAWRLSGRVVASVGELTRVADAVGVGVPLPAASPVAFREAQHLDHAFRAAAERMEASSRTLGQREQQLLGILGTAMDAVISVDESHRIVLFNQAAEAMFLLPREQALGMKIDALLPDAARAGHGAHIDAFAREGGRTRQMNVGRVVHGRRADGMEFPIEASISSSVGEGGRVFTVIMRDITERQRDREALVRSNQRLQEFSDRFDRTILSELEAQQAVIARELHDSLGSVLAGISLLLGSARGGGGPNRDLAIERAQDQIQEAAQMTRTLSRGIMPVGPHPGALLQAVEHFCQQLNASQAVSCSVHAIGRFELIGAEVGNHIYRIVQEAVTNALRHGGATEVDVVLEQATEAYEVTILDNGRGFQPDVVRSAHPGVGLKSMRARAKAIGASIEWIREPGGGCRVVLRLPCVALDGPESLMGPLSLDDPASRSEYLGSAGPDR